MRIQQNKETADVQQKKAWNILISADEIITGCEDEVPN